MKLKDFSAKPCSKELGFEFFPTNKTKLDLIELAEKLKLTEIEIEAKTPFLLLLKIQGFTVSLYNTGKTLVKGKLDEKQARKLAEILFQEL